MLESGGRWKLAHARQSAPRRSGKGEGLGHDFEVMRICVREYLRAVSRMRMRLSMIEGEVAAIQARLSLMGVDYSRGGGCGPNRDKMPDGVAMLEEARDMWAGEYARCREDVERARLICSPDRPECHALWLHEVERRTWAAVAREVGYSEQHARRLADQGVAVVYAEMPERWRRDPIPNAAPR